MKKRAASTALIILEVFAILIAVAAASAAFFYWRLDQGPLSISLFKPSVEFAVERRLPQGYEAEIGGLKLSRAKKRSNIVVRIIDLQIVDAAGNEAAAAPEISMTFDAGDILSGKIGPESIAASGGKFRIVRNERQKVEIPGVRRRPRKPVFGFLSPVFNGDLLKSAFEQAEISNAEITFVDIASGRSWIAPAAHVELNRTSGGLTAAMRGDIDMAGAPAAFGASAQYTQESGVISVVANGADFPIGDILSMFYGEKAAVLDAPVSGRAIIAFTAAGDVLASNFSARAGQGALIIGGVRKPLSSLEWEMQFDPGKNEFTIDRLAFDIDGSSGEIGGAIAISFGDDVRKPEHVAFDLSAQNLVVNMNGFLPEPLPIASFSLAGGYQVQERRLSLDKATAAFLDIGLAGDLAFVFPRRSDDGVQPSIGVKANLKIDGDLDPERLLRIWPYGVAMGARDWIEDRLETAVIDNIKAAMDLAPGVIGEDGGMPDEAMTVTFDIRDAKAYYVEQMTPLVGGAGNGVLRGNSFFLTADRARVGTAQISEGEVEFPVFIPKWEPTYIRFTAKGDANELLGILDEEPLILLSKIDLGPEQFSGTASARIEIMRPNKRDVPADEYRYSGTATFEHMSVTDLAGDVELTDAKGEVDLKSRSMTVKADAKLSDAPIHILWKQNFFEQDGPSTIAVSGEIDASTGDLFGVSSRQFLHGPIEFTANAVGELGALKTLDVNADFTRAALTVDALGWRKPADAPVTGDIEIIFSPEMVSIEKIDIKGDGVEIAGKLEFTNGGALRAAALDKFYLADAADLALTAARDANNALSITAVGDFLNAAPMVEQILGGAPNGAKKTPFNWGAGISVKARIEHMAMRQGVEYNVASLDLWRDAENLQALDFSAFDHDGPPLTVAMAMTGKDAGPERTIEVKSSQIGAMLAGVFGLTSVSGGEGSLLVNLRPPGVDGFSGVLEARDLQMVKAPLLARIFSAGSLDGLTNLLSGEGIVFNYAYGEFDFTNGVVSVKRARATGPSVGVTAEGAFAVGDNGEISLTGAVAPVYGLNSLLGNAPIIGDILVGKKGEGLLALSYSVNGERAAPSVFVNPLSALTPGVFRELVRPERATIEKAGDADSETAPPPEVLETTAPEDH